MIATVKSKIPLLALFSAAMLSPPLYAADGNINVTGRVLENACVIDAGSKNQTVHLGAISGLGGMSLGSNTSWDFNISLRDCPAGSTQAQVKFEGAAAGIDIFAPTNSGMPGAAKNVGFLILSCLDPYGCPNVAPNGVSIVFPLNTGVGNINKLDFKVGYSQVNRNEPVEYGVAIADVQFSIVYP